MSTRDLMTFALVYGFSVIAPGPGVAAVVGRSLARGTHGAPAFLAGFVAADVLWLLLSVGGLAAAARTFPGAFATFRVAGALYLFYLAIRIWRDTGRIVVEARTPARPESAAAAFLGAFALTLGNPKAMVFYLAILPSVVPLGRLDGLATTQLFAVVLLLNPAGLGIYAYGAARAERLLRDPRALRLANHAIGVVLAVVAVGIILQ